MIGQTLSFRTCGITSDGSVWHRRGNYLNLWAVCVDAPKPKVDAGVFEGKCFVSGGFCWSLMSFDVQRAGVLVSLLLLDEARTETLCRVPLCSLASEAPLTRGSRRRRSSQAGVGAAF